MTYARQRASALRQIKAKGTAAKFFRSAGATVKDPVTQQVTTAPADENWVRSAVGLPAGTSWAFRNPGLVITGMEELHVAPEGYVPTPGDRVTWKGATWVVKDAAVYDPDGGGPIYFKALIGR